MQLDSESRAELEAYKASVTPEQARRDANWEAIARRALRGDAPQWVDDEDVVPRRSRRTLAWFVAGTVAIAAAAVAMLALAPERLYGKDDPVPSSASYESRDAHEDAKEAAIRVERTRESRRPAEGPAEPEPRAPVNVDPSAEVEMENAPVPESRPKRRRSSAPRDERPAVEADSLSDIRVETALVGRARAALRDHDPSTASRLLDEHARRFPTGELEQERELLRVVTACDEGKRQSAQRAAKRFRAAFPGSPLLSHLEATCAGGS